MWLQRVVKWPNFSVETDLAVHAVHMDFERGTCSEPGDRLDERQRGSAEIVCDAVASLVDRKTNSV